MKTRESSSSIPLAALFIAVCALGILLVSRFRPEKVPFEADASQLELVNGKLQLKGATAPFSGVLVERYPDSSIKFRCFVANGLLHGISEGFYTNRQLQIREHFDKGVSAGVRTKWFMDGVKMSEATIKEGKIEGTFKRWSEDGSLREQVQMRQGNPEGIALAFHPDGSLKTKATLQGGKVVAQKFWKAGEFKGDVTRIEN